MPPDISEPIATPAALQPFVWRTVTRRMVMLREGMFIFLRSIARDATGWALDPQMERRSYSAWRCILLWGNPRPADEKSYQGPT